MLQSIVNIITIVHIIILVFAYIYKAREGILKSKSSKSLQGFRRDKVDELRQAEIRYHLFGGLYSMTLYWIYVSVVMSIEQTIKPPLWMLVTIGVSSLLFIFLCIRRLPVNRFLTGKLSIFKPVGLGIYPIECVIISYFTTLLMALSTGVLLSPFILLFIITIFATQFVLEIGHHIYAIIVGFICGIILLIIHSDIVSNSFLESYLGIYVPNIPEQFVGFGGAFYYLINIILVLVGSSIFYALGKRTQEILLPRGNDASFLEEKAIDITPILNAFEVGWKQSTMTSDFVNEYNNRIKDISTKKRMFRRQDAINIIEKEKAELVLHQADKSDLDMLRLTIMHRIWGVAPALVADSLQVYTYDKFIRKRQTYMILSWLKDNHYIKSWEIIDKTIIEYDAIAINYDPKTETWKDDYDNNHCLFLPYCMSSKECPNTEGFLFKCNDDCRIPCNLKNLANKINGCKETWVVVRDENAISKIDEYVKNGVKYIYFVCCPANLFKSAPILKKYINTCFIFQPLTVGYEYCIYEKSKDGGSRGLTDITWPTY